LRGLRPAKRLSGNGNIAQSKTPTLLDAESMEGGQILIYQTEGGQTKIEVRLEGETLWLNQAALAKLYQTTIPNINIHIKNIYDEGELSEEATVKDYLIVQTEGGRQVSRQVKHYNLDMKDSDFDKTVKMIEQQKKKLPPDKK
jgi:hypothetical protein